MDIAKEVKDTRERRAKVLEHLNQLKVEEQQTLHELLKLEGEVRLLERLSKDGETKPE